MRPTGTITFLFTDIEGSTGLWETRPDAMAAALARHDEIVREAVSRWNGFAFASGGDGFAVAFGRAGDGLRAAVEAQRKLAGEFSDSSLCLRVRMGLHTGEADERGGDYFGPAVNRAARLMSAARGGQIVLSEVTARLVQNFDGVELVDLGARRLRGVTEPVGIFGLRGEGLPMADQPLTLPGVGNLPQPGDLFVGRGGEVDGLADLLAHKRLVTLTGVGGVGKTRLALEVGRRTADRFGDGVWLVELAPVAEPDAAVHAVASVLGVLAQEGMSMAQAISDWVGQRRLLVILDNCEHLLEPVADLVHLLLTTSTGITVLATSREPLGVATEQVHVLASLPATDAVELFCARATSADDNVRFSAEDRELLCDVCERLDGIPLAIELAAARTRSLGLSDLRSRLDDRFRLLRGGARGVERHQTLRAAITWSYQLLNEPERFLFDRLSVFAGGFDLAAAETICGAASLDRSEVADVLGSLVDKSMVLVDRGLDATRYRLLETLRQYGEEQLDQRHDVGYLHDQHLSYYLSVADAAGIELFSPTEARATATFTREWDNLRSAHRWAITTSSADSAIRLVVASAMFAVYGLRFEHAEWIESTLELVGFGHPSAAFLLGFASLWSNHSGDQARALELASQGVEVASHVDQDSPSSMFPHISWARLGRMNCHGALAAAYVNSGDPVRALQAGRAVEASVSGDPILEAMTLILMVWVGWAADPDALSGYAERQREIATLIPAPTQKALAAFAQGVSELVAGESGLAYRSFGESYAITRGARSVLEGQALQCLALAAGSIGDADTERMYHEALTQLYDTRFWLEVWIVIETLAIHWVVAGRTEPGAVLLGHLEAHHHSHATQTTRRQAALEVLMKDPHAAELMRRGAAMDRDTIVTYAVANLTSILTSGS